MMQLYFGPGACSFVPHAVLQAAGIEFEPRMVKLHKGEQNEDAFKAINPRSQVPVLVDDGEVITQILAIVGYLDKKLAGANVLPTDAVARVHAIEALSWMNNTVHPTFTHFFMPFKFTKDETAQAEIKKFAAVQYKQHMLDLQALVVRAKAQGHEWLTGAHFGPVDAYALTLMRWGSMAGVNPTDVPQLWAQIEKTAMHAPVAATIERERLKLNMFNPT